jgi:hypothetical protein
VKETGAATIARVKFGGLQNVLINLFQNREHLGGFLDPIVEV